MDNEDKPEVVHPDGDLLIVELDDRLEFSALPFDVMDLQVDCTNVECNSASNTSGCTDLKCFIET